MQRLQRDFFDVKELIIPSKAVRMLLREQCRRECGLASTYFDFHLCSDSWGGFATWACV